MAIPVTSHMHQNLQTKGFKNSKGTKNTFYKMIAEKIQALLEQREKSKQASKDLETLNAMSHRELKDLGITRGDINNLVSH